MSIIGNKKLNQKGLTLIEVMITLVVLSIISLGLIAMMTNSLIVMYKYGETTEETLTSQENIEVQLGQEVTNPTDAETFTFNGVTVTISGKEVTDGKIKVFIPE